jgi:hypothetical protein
MFSWPYCLWASGEAVCHESSVWWRKLLPSWQLGSEREVEERLGSQNPLQRPVPSDPTSCR